MTLDLHAVARQMDRLAEHVRRAREDRRRWREEAAAVLDAWGARTEDVANLVRQGSDEFSSWMLAEPLEPLTARRLPDPNRLPEAYTVLATDGGHLDTERHHHVRCYLVNIGRVRITYGPRPHARLEPRTYLEFPRDLGRDADSVLDTESDEADPVVVGGLVGPSRSVGECRELADLAKALAAEPAPPLPAVGLLDATLVLWGLGQDAVSEEVRDRLLNGRLFPAFDDLLRAAEKGDFAFGSYVSKPGSRELVHTLALLADASRKEGRALFQDAPAEVANLADRDVMADLLQPGERSALFIRRSRSTASVENTRYNERGYNIAFFYVNIGQEIARVETLYRLVRPDGTLRHDRIDLLHAVVLDQCRRGGGYPAALVEADRQAVITAEDRRTFNYLLQRVIEAEGEVMETSLKNASKQRPNA